MYKEITFSDIAMKNFKLMCFKERQHYNFAWCTEGAMRLDLPFFKELFITQLLCHPYRFQPGKAVPAWQSFDPDRAVCRKHIKVIHDISILNVNNQ